MVLPPQKPAGWTNSSSSDTHTHTRTNSGSDVLTCELLRELSPIFTPTQAFSAQPQEQNSSKYSSSSAESASSSNQDTNVAGTRLTVGDANTPKVITRGSTPQKTHPPQAMDPLGSESGSSESMIASLPFYDLSNYSRSLNTINLLQSNASGHANATQTSRSQLPHDSSAAQLSEQFNQVPQRFSQFIMDQNAPFLESEASSAVGRRPHSRDISWSMGSQATIFSTRAEEDVHRQASTSLHSSNMMPLSRRKAIRFKEGSRMYRLRLFLRKLALKLRRKCGAMRKFIVRPKRATSTVKKPREKPFFGRSRSINKKMGVARMASVRAAQISAPLANPELESARGAMKVDELTQELKTRAGAGGTPALKQKQEAEGPWRHQKTGSHVGSQVSELSGVAPPPPPHKDNNFQRAFPRRHEKTMFEGAWKQYLSNVLASRIKLRQEVHLFQLLLANQPIPPMYNPASATFESRTARSSRRWSESVGGEIKSHRASIVLGKHSIAESDINSFILGASSSLAPTAPSESPSHFTTTHRKLAASSDHPETSSLVGTETDDESSDERIEKLQQVLNRRSMLGEMLDYDSDELESSASSMFSRESPVGPMNESQRIQPHTNSDPQIIKRYGTLRRRNTDKGLFVGSGHGSSVYPDNSSFEVKSMSRSPGFNNLQAVAVDN